MLFDEPVLQNGCVRLLPLFTLLGGGCELLEDTLHIVLGGKTHLHSVRHAAFKRLCADKRGLSAKRLLHRRTARRGGCGEA